MGRYIVGGLDVYMWIYKAKQIRIYTVYMSVKLVRKKKCQERALGFLIKEISQNSEFLNTDLQF